MTKLSKKSWAERVELSGDMMLYGGGVRLILAISANITISRR